MKRSERHGFTSFPPAAFSPSGSKISLYFCNAGQRQRIRKGIRFARDVGFDSMGQRIDSDVSRERLGHRQRQFVIDDRRRRHQLRIQNHHLDVSRRVGDDGDLCRFAASAGRCRHRHQRRTGIWNALIALEFADRLTIRRSDPDDFRDVNGTAAANCQNRIPADRTEALRAGNHILIGGIGLEIAEQMAGDPSSLQAGLKLSNDVTRGEEGVRHQKRAAGAQARKQLCGLAAATTAGENDTWRIKSCCHRKFLVFILLSRGLIRGQTYKSPNYEQFSKS